MKYLVVDMVLNIFLFQIPKISQKWLFFFFKKTIQAWQKFMSLVILCIFQYIIAKRFRSRIDHLIFWYCLIYNVYIFLLLFMSLYLSYEMIVISEKRQDFIRHHHMHMHSCRTAFSVFHSLQSLHSSWKEFFYDFQRK